MVTGNKAGRKRARYNGGDTTQGTRMTDKI